MNKWGYDEVFMHAQNQPEWQSKTLGKTSLTIGDYGCFASCVTYCWSRKENKNHEIPDFVDEAGKRDGFNSEGLLSWQTVKEITGLTVTKDRPWFGRVFTMRNVLVAGKDRVFSHWVVELSGGLMYDPLRKGGSFVHAIDFYPPVRDSKNQIIRRYLR